MAPQREEEARRASPAAAPTSSFSFTKQQTAVAGCCRKEALEAPRVEAPRCVDDGDIIGVAAAVPTCGGRPTARAKDELLQVQEDCAFERAEVVETSGRSAQTKVLLELRMRPLDVLPREVGSCG